MSDQKSQRPQLQRPPRSFAEWVTFGIAIAILSTIAGLIIYVWVTDRSDPPAIAAERKSQIRETNGKFYIPFEVTNTGGETAASVQVIAELRIGDRIVESGDQRIDFLSKDEKEEGAFVFQRDPRQGELSIRIAGYRLP